MAYTDPLLDIFDEIPASLIEYYAKVQQGGYRHRDESEVHLLTPEEAVEVTMEYQDFHPLVDMSRCLILDQPETSDHLCFLPGLPESGAVFFLSHDGFSPQIVFRDLVAMVRTVDTALERQDFLENLRRPEVFESSDQTSLLAEIRETFSLIDTHDVGLWLMLLIGYADYSDAELFSAIAEANAEFAEVIAEAIIDRPKPSYLPVAKTCSERSEKLAAGLGSRAVNIIKDL